MLRSKGAVLTIFKVIVLFGFMFLFQNCTQSNFKKPAVGTPQSAPVKGNLSVPGGSSATTGDASGTGTGSTGGTAGTTTTGTGGTTTSGTSGGTTTTTTGTTGTTGSATATTTPAAPPPVVINGVTVPAEVNQQAIHTPASVDCKTIACPSSHPYIWAVPLAFIQGNDPFLCTFLKPDGKSVFVRDGDNCSKNGASGYLWCSKTPSSGADIISRSKKLKPSGGSRSWISCIPPVSSAAAQYCNSQTTDTFDYNGSPVTTTTGGANEPDNFCMSRVDVTL